MNALPPPPGHAEFLALYKAEFGVDCEYGDMMARLDLSPAQKMQLVRDVITLLHLAFDHYFDTLAADAR